MAELVDGVAGLDGWAVSTSGKPGLRKAIAAFERAGLDFEIGIWNRGARPQPNARVLNGFEAVLYSPARLVASRGSTTVDVLSWNPSARTGDPQAVTGAKPGPWWSWVFALLGAKPGDTFVDVYPGSGGGQRAWRAYEERGESNG